jgi:hypothetical protein
MPLVLLASLTALAAAGSYAAACWLAPFGPCRCHGHDPLCPRCDGTGRRVRVGRRLYVYLRSLYREAR